MAQQLLATFYVESPNYLYENPGGTPSASIQRPDGSAWVSDSSVYNALLASSANFTTQVQEAHYADPNNGDALRYRYRITVRRSETSQNSNVYRIRNVGTYPRKLVVTFGSSMLERMLYLTVQPDVLVYREVNGQAVTMVRTDTTGADSNPANIQKTVVVIEDNQDALDAREILMEESNGYNASVFLKSNIPVDAYNNDFTLESTGLLADTWLWLQNQKKILMTRKTNGTDRKWTNPLSGSLIQTDSEGQKRVLFADVSSNLLDNNQTVELGLEKPILDLPLFVSSELKLRNHTSFKYTGNGEETENTLPVTVPLSILLKTPHTVKITPPMITLDEYNNYTSFVAVETNDGENWSFQNIDPRLNVMPSYGTGRTAVVIKTIDGFDWDGEDFHNIALTAESTVGTSTISDTVNVHVERYTPTCNALIPKMESGMKNGVTIRHINNDTAYELAGANAVFAITSENEELYIDTGEPIQLATLQLQGRNVRRLVATGTYKGGDAISFSLYGTNDPEGVWTLLRDGSNGTNFAACTTTTSTVGGWAVPLTTSTVNIPNSAPTPYQYYKLVPINRTNDTGLSFVLTQLTLPSGCTITSSPPPLSADAWHAFDHSLSIHGFAGRFTTGLYTSGNTLATAAGALNSSALENLNRYPTVEVEFDTPHRIRSWSLQSVGAAVLDTAFESQATVLVLQGRTLDGTWKILDLARTGSDLFTAAKIRVDRTVQQVELVNAIRISAVAVKAAQNASTVALTRSFSIGYVWFPQIQVFAGEPVIKNKMTSNTQDGISVSSSTTEGYKIFDKTVKETDITPIGSAQFYLRSGEIRQNRVADSGESYTLDTTDFQSLVWLALTFPSTRLIGYLYSIEKVVGVGGNFEENSYAGTISFEYRPSSNPAANTAGSLEGGWHSLGLISLDKCVGYTRNIGQGQLAAWLASHQATLTMWAEEVLGLSGWDRDKVYLIDEVNLRAIRFLNSSGTWQDEGSQLNPVWDAIHDLENTTHYADIEGADTAFEQFRFVVRSVMNTITPTNINPRVQMPEMQFFGLPTNTINTGNAATVAYLKAEDSTGKLHDILGKHVNLPHQSYASSRTYYRFYIGGVQNTAASNRLYLTLQNTSGTMTSPTSGTPANSSTTTNHKAIVNDSSLDLSESGDYRTSPTYFELYLYSSSNEKIILASGYTGGLS